jgi:polyisoprenoid-binding protein YceI
MKISRTRIAACVVFAMSALATSAATADTTYATDQGHTEVLFGWSHAGVTDQNAEFTKATGTLTLAENIEDSVVSVEIDANSLASGFEALDDHLKSADFLNVEKFPTLTFQSTSVKSTGENTMDVTGDLTIHGVTKPVTLQAEMTHKGEHPLGKAIEYYQGQWVGIKATTQIDHQEFGVGSFSTGPISITINSELKAK